MISLIFSSPAEPRAHLPLYFPCCHNEELYLLGEVTFLAFRQTHGNLLFTCKYLQSKNWYLCTDLPCEVVWYFEVLWSFYLVGHTPGCLNILGSADRLLKLASRAVWGGEFIIPGLDALVGTKDGMLIRGICKLYNETPNQGMLLSTLNAQLSLMSLN